MKKTRSSILCKLGLHKWKDYGDFILIAWVEPGIALDSQVLKRKGVYTKKKCSRCGVRRKRILADNEDGTVSCVGWSRMSEDEPNEDIKKESKKQ